MDESRIFRFLQAALDAGNRCALVSVVATEGPSMRLPGAHMGVVAEGDYVGSVSGGCIEQAVVAEAQDTIKELEARLTRFGKGSKYIDIRLPCGGAMDLHFQPWDDRKLTETVLAAIAERRPYSLRLGLDQTAPSFEPDWHPTQWDNQAQSGAIGYWPKPKLVILGQGENVTKLAEVATVWGAEIAVHTPDKQLASDLNAAEYGCQLLARPADLGLLESDPWTAIVLLFHDHEWEVPVIEALIDQPHFYFGAMGSRKTHQKRLGQLLEAGIAQAKLNKICAPIGLVTGARDPATLAISILAEVIDYHKRADFAVLAAEQ